MTPPDSLAFDPATPTRLAKYRLLDFLGRGASGEVYRAQDIHTNRLVALKLLWGESDTQAFVREVESHARLHHSNIAQIYEAGEWPDGRFYIALQLVDGSDLSCRFGDESLRDPLAAAQLISKVARAVHFAHEQFVLHCDLKPQNILIDRRGMPFVSDFSIAHPLDREHVPIVAASLPYMAPEQCDPANQLANRWTDVYALGVILYQLVTGKTPYPHDWNLEQRREAFAKRELPQAPSEVAARDHYPLGRSPDRELDRICAGALAVNPHLRYASADAFADDIDRWVLGLPVRGATRAVPATRSRVQSFVRRNLRALGLPVISLLCVLAISGFAALAAVRGIENWFMLANRTTTQLQGQILASRFEGYRRELSELTQDPAVKRIFQLGSRVLPADVTEAAGQKLSAISWRGGPDQFYFIDPHGCFVNYWPSSAVSPDVYLSWYGFRDYFSCAEGLAQKHSRHACISRVFRSEYDWVPNTLRIAVSSAVYADDQTFIGVLAASWPIERSLSELTAGTPPALQAKNSILVARDRERAQLKLKGVEIPTCGRAREPSSITTAGLGSRIGPAPREELMILPRSSPRDERFLSARASARIGARIASGVLNDEAFFDPRSGQSDVVGYAALNQHPASERAVDQAPVLVVAIDRAVITSYTLAIYGSLALLMGGAAVLLGALVIALRRRDQDQLRWLKGSSP